MILIVFDRHKDSNNQEINVHNEMNNFDVASFKKDVFNFDRLHFCEHMPGSI